MRARQATDGYSWASCSGSIDNGANNAEERDRERHQSRYVDFHKMHEQTKTSSRKQRSGAAKSLHTKGFEGCWAHVQQYVHTMGCAYSFPNGESPVHYRYKPSLCALTQHFLTPSGHKPTPAQKPPFSHNGTTPRFFLVSIRGSWRNCSGGN